MEIIKYDHRYDNLLDQYQLNEAQLQFTTSPQVCVQLSLQDKDRHAYLVFENDQFVSFFALHEKKGVEMYSNNPQAILFRSFSTDCRFVGQGFGKKVIRYLPKFVCTTFKKNEIILAVNVKNVIAQQLYLNNGFVDTGRRATSQKGESIIMSQTL